MTNTFCKIYTKEQSRVLFEIIFRKFSDNGINLVPEFCTYLTIGKPDFYDVLQLHLVTP
jgi:hypothetical protein